MLRLSVVSEFQKIKYRGPDNTIISDFNEKGWMGFHRLKIMDTSDLPGGVVNIVTGDQEVLAEVLANHYDVEGLWYWGSRRGSRVVEEASAADMKRTWVNYGLYHDWEDDEQGQNPTFLRKATEIKNIWIPYGE